MASISVTPRFILAKYVPDLDRMEPRNIGVVLWMKGKICTQFLPTEHAAQFVEDLSIYSRWVDFWTNLAQNDKIEQRRGFPVPITDSQCVDAFITNQKGKYMLVDSGELLDDVKKRNLPSATQFLFNELVAPRHKGALHDKRAFEERCLDVLSSCGITSRPDFRRKFPVSCTVLGQDRQVHFSYGIGGDVPAALFQKVQLSSEDSWISSTLKIQSVLENAISPDRCIALYRSSDIKSKQAEQGQASLSRLCEVIDVDSPDAKDRLTSIAL